MDRADVARQFHVIPRAVTAERHHIRHAQHQVGEPVGGIERAGRRAAAAIAASLCGIGGKRGDLAGERAGVKSSCVTHGAAGIRQHVALAS